MLFGIQGQLNHTFPHLVVRDADEISQNEFLGEEPTQVTEPEKP